MLFVERLFRERATAEQKNDDRSEGPRTVLQVAPGAGVRIHRRRMRRAGTRGIDQDRAAMAGGKIYLLSRTLQRTRLLQSRIAVAVHLGRNQHSTAGQI